MAKPRRRFPLKAPLKLRRAFRKGAQNALEIARLGRLAPAAGLRYEVVDHSATCRLRRYGEAHYPGGHPDGGRGTSSPLVLVPPLMLTAEIYDVAPDLSAVRALTTAGVDTWVVDFGAPEREAGGMQRTLDDHVRAVAWAARRVHEVTGRPVHLAGYSQGGMFAYQAAAFLGGEHLASLVTFGSPVDIHRNVPNLAGDLAGRFIRAVRPLVELPLARIEGLPGTLSSTGFKLLTPRKEVEQLVDFVRKLNDRDALQKRESRRRFLGGEGFVAWPGPALQSFFEEFIVHNRMMSGGMVIDGKSLTLADIRVPILYFVGGRDDFARPPSVRAVVRATPDAEHHEVTLPAGHFGLVVGSTSLRETWPTVVEWIAWRDGRGDKPRALRPPEPLYHDEPEEYFEVDFDYELLTGELAGAVQNGWRHLGNLVRDASDTLHGLRWQVPRLRRLERMTGATRISPSLTLERQARTLGQDTFFMWRGRAFSYADANRRVHHVARGLCASGIQPGDRVGVWMTTRPSFLSMVTALNRLGAVAVLLGPDLHGDALSRALEAMPLAALATDPERAAEARAVFAGEVLVLGGGGTQRELPAGATDMEAIDTGSVAMPEWYRPDPGHARDPALVFVRLGKDGALKVSQVSNGRWAFSALGVASAATLTPDDTVYCCLPLHHPTGLLVSVGGALVGGSRLALADRFDKGRFWREVRRYGATVVFYAGEMARPLVRAPRARGERQHPVRLFAGSGMRADVWEQLEERFGVGVLEFYASTERNLVLANASGKKRGALGRPLPGSADIALVRYDFHGKKQAEGLVERGGRLVRCDAGEPGLAVARVGPQVDGPGVRRGVFEPGDRWLVTNDVLRRDQGGDYWFVDRLANVVRTAMGPVGTPHVEDALYLLPEVELAVAYPTPDATAAHALVMSGPLDAKRVGERLAGSLHPHELPRRIDRVATVAMTEGFRPIKAGLGRQPVEGVLQTLVYRDGRYLELAEPPDASARSPARA